jgi:hypothetical protein
MQVVISIFLYFLGLLCALRYDLFWFHGLLRRMSIVLLFDEIFCRYQWGPFDFWCHLFLGFLFDFGLDELYVGDRGVLKSPTTTVLECTCAFKSFSVYLMKSDVLTLDVYWLIPIMSFWCIAPFINMKCPFLSYLTNVSLKSILSI